MGTMKRFKWHSFKRPRKGIVLQLSTNLNIYILRKICCRSMVSNLKIMAKCVIINTERETEAQIIQRVVDHGILCSARHQGLS